MTVVGYIPGASFTLATAPDDRPTRFCFRCRKHLPHTWALNDDPSERQPSYYDPTPALRCSGCGEDHTVHPSSYRDGPPIPGPIVAQALREGAAKTRASEPYASTYKAALDRFFADNAPTNRGEQQ